MTTTLHRHWTWVTSLDGLDHAVTDAAMAAGMTADADKYVAWCGVAFLPDAIGRAAGSALSPVFGSSAASGSADGRQTRGSSPARPPWPATVVDWPAIPVAVAMVVIFGDGLSGGEDRPVSVSVGDGRAVTAVQLRRALVVLLREGESACSQAAFDVGAGRCADEDLSDLAAGLGSLADAVRRYPRLRDEM
jgi:hypothetical protein